MNPPHGALPVPYVPVRATRGALVAHRYTYDLRPIPIPRGWWMDIGVG